MGHASGRFHRHPIAIGEAWERPTPTAYVELRAGSGDHSAAAGDTQWPRRSRRRVESRRPRDVPSTAMLPPWAQNTRRHIHQRASGHYARRHAQGELFGELRFASLRSATRKQKPIVDAVRARRRGGANHRPSHSGRARDGRHTADKARDCGSKHELPHAWRHGSASIARPSAVDPKLRKVLRHAPCFVLCERVGPIRRGRIKIEVAETLAAGVVDAITAGDLDHGCGKLRGNIGTQRCKKGQRERR